MNWTEIHKPKQPIAEETNRRVVFPAFLPNIQVTDGTLIALIRSKNAWAGPNNLLSEIKKSYPNATLIKHTTHKDGVATEHDAISFSEPSTSKFASDYMEWKAEQERPRTR